MDNLLTEENRFDRGALFRIGSWGVAAVGAVTLATMSNQWALGTRREHVAAADLVHQAQQLQSLARETQTETRRLASAIETLNTDRDRLFSRVTVIEQGLDSVTGALARQIPPASADTAGSSPSSASTTSSVISAAGAQVAQQLPAPPATLPAPVVAAVATTAATPARADAKPDIKPNPKADAKADAIKPEAAGATATASPLGTPPPASASTAMTQPASVSPASMVPTAKVMIGPPDPAATKPGEAAKANDHGKSTDARLVEAKAPGPKRSNVRIAEAAADSAGDGRPKGMQPDPLAPGGDEETAAAAAAMDDPAAEVGHVAVKRTDFAVDLGTANTLGGLRALWRGVRRANIELGVLNPLVVIRENQAATGMQLHLAAGPLKDAAAAARICAALVEAGRVCEATVYDGQHLAMTERQPTPPASRSASDGSSDVASETKSEPKAEPKPDSKSSAAKHGLRHAKKEEPAPQPPPKPESSSTLSTLFGRK